MQGFQYASPATLKEAAALLGTKWGEAEVLAGGTDLISLMKDLVHSPARVVSLKNVKDLGGIKRSNAGLRLGAMVTFDELASNRDVRSEYPSLTAAALGVASPQIRNMGTVGGDLCQRPRCWYFRQGHGLLAMKEGKSLVVDGQNKYHAIFGGGPAHFVSPSSLGPALVALGAKVELVSASGNREVPLEKFFVSPQNDQARETALLPNEILTAIIVPPARGIRNSTYEVRHKEALDWPLATASVALKMKGSTVESARIILGHVAPTPYAAKAAEQAIAGKSLTEDLAEQIGKTAVEGAKPLSQNAYKVQLAKVAVKRALLEAMKAKA